jgi:putative DNA primase/helicase
MNGRQSLIDYMQRALGYTLTGDINEHAMFFHHGEGANGKSVLLSTAAKIMGGYHKTASMELFVVSHHSQHLTFTAALHGTGRQWAEAKLKDLTGGTEITANFMRCDPFEFYPKFKLHVSGNNKPKLRSVGEAMKRRINLIPYDFVVPKTERDLKLADTMLAEEGPAILRWMIDGCLAWQAGGLNTPEEITKATDEYFTSEDTVARWIDEWCEKSDGNWNSTEALYSSFVCWIKRCGEQFVPTLRAFSERLAKVDGLVSHKSSKREGVKVITRQGFKGLLLHTREAEAAEDEKAAEQRRGGAVDAVPF